MKSDYLKTIQVTCKGEVAAGVLAIDQDVFVLGNTSRGIFLETSSRWLVFLSYEGFRSPLTVTLAEIPVSLADPPVIFGVLPDKTQTSKSESPGILPLCVEPKQST